MRTYQSVAGALLVSALCLYSERGLTLDLLEEDDLAFDTTDLGADESHWTDPFKVTLAQNHTQAPGQTVLQRSEVRVEYADSLAEGWYLRLDTRYRYFWQRDDLAEHRGEAYGKNKWQDAWLQYSRGACAAKVGRQTLIWGEVEGAFVTDVVAPFDYTEQLLTDYADIRLPQDMAVVDCFFDGSQVQLFGVHEAATDLYAHKPLQIALMPGQPALRFEADPGDEWGVKYKWRVEGADFSVMYASLYNNTPAIALRDGGIEPVVSRFDLFGVGSSIAIGRLLLKLEAAYKNDQPLNLNAAAFSLPSPPDTELSDRIDAAFGFEYTTAANHAFNGGIWTTHYQNDKAGDQNIQVLTGGWRKTYLNDNLTMSLLGNWVSEPRYANVTVLSDYQLTDYWSFSLALGIADVKDSELALPMMPSEKFGSLSVRYEF